MTDDKEGLQSRINELESAAKIARDRGDYVFAQALQERADTLTRERTNETA